MSGESKAVFLSYASEDAEAASRIADALRAMDIEVWFDRAELRGGDAWDRRIRQQIHDSRLFIAIISAHTEARDEGYFRREWKLAVDRTQDMADKKAFLVPIVIDGTSERGASVPEKFREFQWTHLPGGEASSAFVEHVRRLLSLDHAGASQPPRVVPVRTDTNSPTSRDPVRKVPHWQGRLLWGLSAIVVLGVGYLALDRFWFSKHLVTSTQVAVFTSEPAAPAQGMIPEKSIAVLPFVDMSERHDQEYFSDGLSEELIDLLTKIPELRVPARTSSFFFKGKPEDIPTIAQRLRVAHVLEGSVRKFGKHLRVTAQLVRADNGYHLWSESYDREVDDLFKVQDDIAGSVVRALNVSLLRAEKSRVAPTSNSEAHTLYLHAQALARVGTPDDSIQAYKELRHALALDPGFALAWAALAELLTDDSANWIDVFGGGVQDYGGVRIQLSQAAHDAASRSVQLGADLAEAHLAKGLVLYWMDWNWAGAEAELKRAYELNPTNAEITEAGAALANTMGRFDDSLRLANLATTQDPLGTAYWDVGAAQYRRGALKEAAAAYKHLIELYPTARVYHFRYGLVLLSQGDAQTALSEMERESAPWYRHVGMVLVLDALNRSDDAAGELAEALQYSGMAYQISYIYAARKDEPHALLSLESAYRLHDSGLLSIKGDPMLKSLQGKPPFVSLMHRMNLPE